MNTSLEDRAVARRRAMAIADLLDSEAIAFRRVILGEPPCQYRVPIHAENSWVKALVSDTDFVREGEPRGRAAICVPSCGALKRGWRKVGATIILPKLSTELGFKIYTTERKK
jgi:hypothetical protein